MCFQGSKNNNFVNKSKDVICCEAFLILFGFVLICRSCFKLVFPESFLELQCKDLSLKVCSS